MLAQQDTDTESARVIQPDEHEHAEQQARCRNAHDGIEHRHGQSDIAQREERAFQAVQRILPGAIQLHDGAQQQIGSDGQQPQGA